MIFCRLPASPGRLVLALAAALITCAGSAMATEPALIPFPAELQLKKGSFTVSADTGICREGAASDATMTYFRQEVASLRGLALKSVSCATAGIRLEIDPDAPMPKDGYTLDVTPKDIVVRATNDAGLFYGAVTMAQLLSPDDRFGASVSLNAMHIFDYPRFAWRGLMLDPARHFLPVKNVKTVIDQMALHKLNVLHMHLTDDQGWRIEIKRYPDLTRVGAWRTPPSNGGLGSEKAVYGGFYTQDDIRDIVAYAAERHITVVPELDMPGHAQAAVAGHPALSVTGQTPQVSGDWGVNPYLYNTDADSMRFIDNVLDEVMALFPSTYIHLGGDEAVKDQWKDSPKIQAQMKALGVTSEDAMQSWFMEQVGQYLASHGRRMMGWDEILDGGVPPSATVMSWRGNAGAIKAARLDHDVVVSTLYLDNLQTARADEPAGRMGILTLNQVYDFDAMPSVLDAQQARHVLGGQMNLWSEYLTSNWYVQNAAFPRVDAASEALWTPAAKKDWAGFLDRLSVQMARYRQQGVHYSDLAFAADFQLPNGRNAALKAGGGEVEIDNQTGYGRIRYTLDGSDPDKTSPLYSRPLDLKFGASIKARVFATNGLPIAAPRSYDFSAAALRTFTSADMTACGSGDLGLRVPLTPDSTATSPVYEIDLFNDCFVYQKADLDGVKSISVDIARLSRNYGLAHDQAKVLSHPASTPYGELVIHQDGCDGEELERAPLGDPAITPNRLTLTAPLSSHGVHNLCFIFTAPINGPFYAIDQARLLTE
jgi:hexosaminidase